MKRDKKSPRLVSGVEPLGDLGAKVHISSPLSIAVKCRILKRTQSTFSFGCSLANQVYIIKVKDSSGHEQSVKAFAK